MSDDKRADGDADDLLPEYDFSGGVRGKYAKRYAEGTNVVVLEPDVARVFPNANAVNEALRALAHIAERQLHQGPDEAEPAEAAEQPAEPVAPS